jgi:hypothetical protein
MADPTLGLTFDDMRIRVAEYLGIAYYGSDGAGVAQLPIDTHDLDLVSRNVNDGYRRFLTDYEKWNFLDVPMTLQFVAQSSGTATGGSTTTLINSGLAGKFATSFYNGFTLRVTHASGAIDVYVVTAYNGVTGTFTFAAGTAVAVGDTYELAAATAVEGQNFRYYMPDDFYGILLQPFTYDVGGPRIEVNPVDESRIRELFSGANTSGTPSVVAVRPINTTATSTGKRWEAMFWPKPTGTERITTRYKRFPAKLTTGTDRSVAGYQHDGTILAAAIAEAERQQSDTMGVREKAYLTALERSIATDKRAAAVRSRDYGDSSEDRGYVGRRPLNYYGVDTYNGNSLN